MNKFLYYYMVNTPPVFTMYEAKVLAEDAIKYHNADKLLCDDTGYYIERQSLIRLTKKKYYYATDKETTSKERNQRTKNDDFSPGQ